MVQRKNNCKCNRRSLRDDNKKVLSAHRPELASYQGIQV